MFLWSRFCELPVWTSASKDNMLFQEAIVSWECNGSIWHFLTFDMLLIFISRFSTDEHFKLTKGSKLFLPFENLLLFYVFHNFKKAI